jgi:hypothetical protein
MAAPNDPTAKSLQQQPPFSKRRMPCAGSAFGPWGRSGCVVVNREIVELEKVEAEIHEGRYHTGLASVVLLVARR